MKGKFCVTCKVQGRAKGKFRAKGMCFRLVLLVITSLFQVIFVLQVNSGFKVCSPFIIRYVQCKF